MTNVIWRPQPRQMAFMRRAEDDDPSASGQHPDGEVLQPYTFGPGDPADEGHEEHPEE